MEHRRTALIAGLLDLAAFLEANPDVPVPRGPVTVRHFPANGTDAEMTAEVDRIAALLGSEIDPEHLRFHHYCTGIAFGPVRFESTAILSPARSRHDPA